MSPLIQCVPNFSEGRDERVIEAIADAVRAVPSATLADYSRDPDHNRLVVSILGGPDAIREAADSAARMAVELIDMRRHAGCHPRIGAVDVIPFVPIREAGMPECVRLSHRVGRDIGNQLHVPVFFYECSALKSHHTNLADVRRGGYERMAEIGLQGNRSPDVGPHEMHPTAGATVVGARNPLVAFNVNLRSNNMDAAREIAQHTRETGGGLAGVKAIGVWLESRSSAQVSMNVTRPDLVTLPEVFGFVLDEAKRFGLEVDESEIIGLIPERAFGGASPSDLLLRDFKPTQVLEYWLSRL